MEIPVLLAKRIGPIRGLEAASRRWLSLLEMTKKPQAPEVLLPPKEERKKNDETSSPVDYQRENGSPYLS